ncbi:MAG: DUF2007 domain-containing protein [Porphyromonas sp.]|nr:DUF2007 domain-containing protein [Porphyromonas sp.]
MNDKMMVEVFSAREGSQVQLAATFLEHEGFTVSVEHELTSQVLGGATAVSLMVPQDQAVGARQRLQEAGYVPADTSDPLAEVDKERKWYQKKIARTLLVIAIVLLLLALYVQLQGAIGQPTP